MLRNLVSVTWVVVLDPNVLGVFWTNFLVNLLLSMNKDATIRGYLS